ncbi:hypothetical protein C8Q80DRAFT_1164244 [Daedaleopsis nitida]|nr:hypothetical protein C8Q80DRAFT_1164244 [Daedaleopsis nitida]
MMPPLLQDDVASSSGRSPLVDTSTPSPKIVHATGVVDAAPSANVNLTVPQHNPTLPPRPEFTPFIVPNLCEHPIYDGEDFWTYPARHNWVIHARDKQCHVWCPPGRCSDDVDEDADEEYRKVRPPLLSRPDGSSVTAASKVAFLQSWLFFGTLNQVSRLCGLGLDIEAEFLVDGGRSVSTSALNGLPRRWFSALGPRRSGQDALMEQILTHARQIGLLLNRKLAEDDHSVDGYQIKYEYTAEESRVLHSLDILARILGLHLLLHIYASDSKASTGDTWHGKRIVQSIDWYHHVEGMDQLSDDQVYDHLLERGWCDSELGLLDHHELFVASLLERPRARSHSSCTDRLCYAYQTDEATYQTAHVDEGCTCDFVGAQTEELTDVLSQGNVPAVVITENLEVLVVRSDQYPYIAISHVWADGLGNPRDNALPACQLRRLREFVSALHGTQSPTSPAEYGTLAAKARSGFAHTPTSTPLGPVTPVALWIDTLCVPVHPIAKTYRKKAIELMGRTYNDARAVLVLDRELEIVNSATAAFLELGIRILCSGWMKRLWTFQEATLASEAHGEDRIFFQMRDGPFPYRKYDRERTEATALDGRTTGIDAPERALLDEIGVILLLGEQIPSVRVMREGTGSGVWSPFKVIFSSIEHRTTSKAEDIPLCLASLMGKDVSSILSSTNLEQRMASFYMVMRTIPAGLIWNQGAQRLGMAPFRWAPLSLAECGASSCMGWPNFGVCDAAGLHIQYPGFIFKELRANETRTDLPERLTLVYAPTGKVAGTLRRAWVNLPYCELELWIETGCHRQPTPRACPVPQRCDCQDTWTY